MTSGLRRCSGRSGRKREDNQCGQASHGPGDNHLVKASHSAQDNHQREASHLAEDTQDEKASQSPEETQDGKAQTTDNTMNNNIKTLVRGAYDIQKLRIQTGNRIVANFKAKLGQAPGEPESDLDAEGKAVLNDLRRHYKKITDGVTIFPRQATFKGDELISSYTELCLIAQYVDLEESEARHFRNLEKVLLEYPIYTEFLKHVKGVGPAMAGVIVSEIDIHKAEYPSSLWKYAGLDVASDGAGRSRRSEHLVDKEYTSSDGEVKKKRGITFNPFLKTKLVGVLGSLFLRAGENPYREIYDNYKHRLTNMPAHKDKSKGHIHNMAIRYMVKRFLVDLYREWRRIEGLPIADEYSDAKLGITHKKAS